jgi:hypothetical protein
LSHQLHIEHATQFVRPKWPALLNQLELLMNHSQNPESEDPREADAGTIAGRAPAPLAPKPDADHATPGSPGAIADRDQATERAQASQKDSAQPPR